MTDARCGGKAAWALARRDHASVKSDEVRSMGERGTACSDVGSCEIGTRSRAGLAAPGATRSGRAMRRGCWAT